MIKLKMSIEDISEYQTGILPKNAVKIETPQSIEEMMKKAAPIAAVLCVLMFVTMLCKTVMNKTVVISHVFILIGFCLGYICLVIHRDFALKNKSPCSACEFQAKQGISILGIKLLFFSV